MSFTMKDMLEAGIHFGHRTRFWNPKMAPYLFGARDNIHIINLDYSYRLFNEALQFVAGVAGSRGKVLFVGTKYAAQGIIQTEAIRAGMPFVNHRWLGGMLTNYKTIRQSIKRLKELEEMKTGNSFEGLTKKETLNMLRELAKLELSLGGIKNMGGLPDALFVVDTGQEKIAIAEANRLGIPVIGVVDSNNDPAGVDYMIPGNDDSIRSIDFYAKHIADTILAARSHLPEEPATKKADTETAKPEKKVVAKRATRKKAAKEEDVTDAAAEGEQQTADADNEPKASKKATTKKPTAKKTASSTVSKAAESDAAAADKKATSAKANQANAEADNEN